MAHKAAFAGAGIIVCREESARGLDALHDASRTREPTESRQRLGVRPALRRFDLYGKREGVTTVQNRTLICQRRLIPPFVYNGFVSAASVDRMANLIF